MTSLDQKLTVYFVVPCMIAVVESYIRSLTIGDHVEYNSTASIGIYKNHNVIYTASYVPQQTFLKKNVIYQPISILVLAHCSPSLLV
jgi:hypothetical protein